VKFVSTLTGAVALAAASILPSASQATELLFTWSNAGTTLETFDLDTTAGLPDLVTGYLFYPITNDSIAGNDGVYFGDASRGGAVGSGPSPLDEVMTATNIDDFSPAIYSGTGTFIDFTPGETFGPGLARGDVLTVSALPEPAPWSMLLLGVGVLGMVQRVRRTSVAQSG
jgi:hypothetical protein